MIVVRHRGSGWVREIARKDDDSPIEAEFEPETGIVTVYEGRREFKALEQGRPPGGPGSFPGARVRPVPDARGRGGRERRLLVGRRADPRPASPG